ncbi:hypothetical protein BJ085DRAFT_39993 [Dimargaris cristalligena]|uniref:Uncharacterized protein n=1 Tax=Dimargaris cristalligena TaxID=215637 RepID=A0A4V1J4B0_9FUNG|nr:hypothetical protein BJ085DRAFT_39993 [Dimargaris cristalligena]|eukprot:RKP34929.1 hypothetical protein BJ085DRAFT_39993 [Dimargaris cristalligena]
MHVWAKLAAFSLAAGLLGSVSTKLRPHTRDHPEQPTARVNKNQGQLYSNYDVDFLELDKYIWVDHRSLPTNPIVDCDWLYDDPVVDHGPELVPEQGIVMRRPDDHTGGPSPPSSQHSPPTKKHPEARPTEEVDYQCCQYRGNSTCPRQPIGKT